MPLTDAQRDEAVQRYQSGEKMPSIAESFGVTKMAISKLLRKRGVTTPAPTSALPLEEVPANLQLPYMPPIIGVCGNLAVIVADQEQWSVHDIMQRYAVPHAQAVVWFALLAMHLRLSGYSHLFLWKDELECPGLRAMLLHKAGRSVERLNARDCVVRETGQSDADAFYQQHHLQGGCHGALAYGLYLGERLVACMSFNDASVCRGVEDAHLLQRFASVGSVRGAASRLLAAFRREHSGPVVSYSDQRYAPGGGLYRTLGFACEAEYRPDYRYWRDGRWYAKNSKQRKHLIAEGGTGRTEFEMAESLGYKRCYDMAKLRWLLR